MSTKKSIKIKHYIFNIMNYIVKTCFRIFSRILKITLFELCWITVVTISIFILWIYNNEAVRENTQNPVILWWTPNFPGTSETRYCPDNIECDIYSNRSIEDLYNIDGYLFYGSNINFDDLPLPRIYNKIWGLYHEESPRNVEELMHEEVLNLFNFSSTFSRFSDVPYPLQYLQSLEDVTSLKYFVSTAEKNKYLKEISPVIYMQTDCETSTERDAYVKELMKFVNIDSYGGCLNNKVMPTKFIEDYLNNLHDDEILRFIARYKFVIAIENGVCNDYITEKLWRAIKIGTVPIYFGSPLVRDWLPNNKSAILLEDFPSPEIMSKHISYLLNDDNLYETYLEHKIKGLITNEELLNEIKKRPYQLDTLKTAEKFECFVCKKLHENRNGILVANVVNKKHYNCPKPISALGLKVNPSNSWAHSYETAKNRAALIYKKVTMT
ncbi:alpha-(1,3)-fucosyltransferase 10 [Battus philenor]|uniref:alpha-(1,3)-fucosyltransferase 10 n=1 Tax=Battus philenor TaxID=42288 RepID=UPI0035D08194